MNKLKFVIHKHDATNLHYDFRLEIGGTMPSWAIPKGPTLDPKMKRLAMETTEHDIEYKDFEGNIPEGQYKQSLKFSRRSNYGAGPVMIWDEGYYDPEIEVEKGKREKINDFKEGNEVMRKGKEKGELKFFLHGKKLKGSFALVKTRGFGPKNSWLLIKHKDNYCQKGYNANEYDFSARSGRILEEIRKS